MIATNPYYITSYQTCRCSYTMCCCFQGGNLNYQTQVIGGYYSVEPLPKAQANKQYMNDLRYRVKGPVAQRVRLKTPSMRPSMQALSMRIR